MDYSTNMSGTGANTGYPRQAAATPVIGILIVLKATGSAIAAMLHAGIPLPVGFTEPVIIPAAIVEGLIALFFAVSAYAVFVRAGWAWAATVYANAFAVLGYLLGTVVIAMHGAPTTEANYVYHRIMLSVASAALVFWLTPTGRAALGHGASNRR